MRILSKKEGVLYNKLLIVCFLVLLIAGMAWVVIAGVSPGGITLNKPDDNSVDWDGGFQDFNCTLAGSAGTYNVTLWHNFSGTWKPNQTILQTSTMGSPLNFTLNLSNVPDFVNGIWTCAINDSTSQNFSSTNRTFHLDNTAPTAFDLQGSSGPISNLSVTTTNTQVLLNWSATSEPHFMNYTVSVFNGSDYSGANLTARNVSFSISTTSLTLIPTSGSSFPDDTYYWYVIAYENSSGGRSRMSSHNWSFTVDTDFGSIAINSPENRTWDNDGSITFSYTASDNNVDTCRIYYNVTGASAFFANQSNSSLTDGITVVSSPAITLSDGNYTWYVWCNDTGGHQENSSRYYFYIDATNPFVALNNPSNASYNSEGVVYFNFTATDTNPDSCVLWTNRSGWASNQTTTYVSGTQKQFSNSLTFSTDGAYVWNIKCNDSAGNSAFNATNYTLRIDTAGPSSLTLASPSNNGYSSSAATTFNYSATDVFLDSCVLYGNFSGTWAKNVTNSSLPGGSVSVLAVPTLSDGVFKWNALCNDSSAHTTWLNSSGNFIVIVDTTAPTTPGMGNVLLGGIYYGNNTLGNSLTPTVNWTASNETNFRNYTIQFSNSTGFGAENITATIYQTSRTNTTATVSSNLADSTTHYWRVIAYDLAGNSATSIGYNYTTDATNPTVSIKLPTIPSLSSTSNDITFRYNASDNNLYGCVLWANFSGTWAINRTNNSVSSNINDTFTVIVPDGNYVWNIKCNDSAHTPNTVWANSTTNYTMIVSASGPTILTSINGTRTASRVISFSVAHSLSAINLTSVTITPDSAPTSNFNRTNDCTTSDGNYTYSCSYTETGLTVGTNILNITARNSLGVSASYYLWITPTGSQNFTKALASGWNLISTPLVLESSSITNVVANNTKISKIYYFDGNWETWDSGVTCTSDCLTTIEPLKGYWVKTTAATSISFFGNYTIDGGTKSYGMSYPLSLSASTWYTIGHYDSNGDDDVDTNDALSSLSTGTLCSTGGCNFDHLYLYNSSGLINVYKTSNFAADNIWDRGVGFWIHTTSADTLTN